MCESGTFSDNPTGPSNLHFLCLLAVAAVIRLVYLLDFHANSVFWDSMILDAKIYDEWARAIASGEWAGEDDVYSLPPLYPYFLAFLYRVIGGLHGVVYVVQSLLGLVNVWLIYSIGRRVFNGWTPIVAAAIAVGYGTFMFTDAKLMSTTLALTLGLSLARLMLEARDRRTMTFWGLCGLLLGVNVLVRPEMLLFAPFAVWWIVRVLRKPAEGQLDRYSREKWIAIALFTVLMFVAIAPVAFRNWVVSGDWSLSNLVSSQAGITFYQGNNEHARGLYASLAREGFSSNPGTQAAEERKIAECEAGQPLSRSEVTRFWMAKGVRWILANPGKFLVLEARKARRFFGSYEYSNEYMLNVERESVRSLWIAPLPFAVIASFGLIGMVIFWRQRGTDPGLLLGLFVLSNFIVVMAFYMSSRYRMPSAPFLILFAAYGLVRLLDGVRNPVQQGRRKAWILLFLAAILAGVFHVQLDESAVIQESNVHFNAGIRYGELYDYERAATEFRRATEKNPRFWRAYFNLGNALFQLDRREQAIEAYKTGLRLNPKAEKVRLMLREIGEDV